MLTNGQRDALEKVVQAFGWDRMTVDQLGLMLWAAFHYYIRRL